MKEKEIKEIVEERFKTIKKLSHKILKEFNADDIHDFRVEIKKLRAFLRLLDTEKEIDGPLIPTLLKTFYGYVGIIRNIQLYRHNLYKYITDYKIEKPEEYFKILDAEQSYWRKNAEALMADNNFDGAEKKLIKELPAKLEKSAVKKFAKNKLYELKLQLNNLSGDAAIHNIRKILKDILYVYDYIKDHTELPAAISKEEDLKLFTQQLGNFRDKCIQLEFLTPEYLDKIKNEDEKNILVKIKDQYLREKQIMMQELTYSFNELRNQLKKES
jgi:CHAD domain-containing protein